MSTKVVWKGLDVFQKKVFDSYVATQTKLLIDYAVKTTQEIGNAIKEYNGGIKSKRKPFDRTGNLLDSLCWCLTYRGKIIESGYYQNRASELSYLHEFSPEFEAFPVGGHTLAEKYVQQYGKVQSDGWRIFFTIRAPYWGYWEQGFNMKVQGKSYGIRQFSVMTQFFDKVTKDLSPAKVSFRNKVPEYTSYTRKYRIKVGRTKSGKFTYGTSTHYGSLQTRYNRYDSGKSDPYRKYSRKRYHYV